MALVACAFVVVSTIPLPLIKFHSIWVLRHCMIAHDLMLSKTGDFEMKSTSSNSFLVDVSRSVIVPLPIERSVKLRFISVLSFDAVISHSSHEVK